MEDLEAPSWATTHNPWEEAMKDAPKFQSEKSSSEQEANRGETENDPNYYHSMKELVNDRIFKRHEVVDGAESSRIRFAMDSEGNPTRLEGDDTAWEYIELPIRAEESGDSKAEKGTFTFDTLRKEMEGRTETGSYVSEERFESEEDFVYDAIDDEVDVEVERRIEDYELQSYHENDAKKALSRHYDRMMARVSKYSSEHRDEDGTRPSIRTACNQMIARRIIGMSHAAEQGTLTEKDKENFCLEMEALSVIRFHAERREDEEKAKRQNEAK